MTDAIVRRIRDVAVARLEGDVDLAVTAVLHRRIAREAVGGSALVLDLSAVAFLDSAGVRLVDELARTSGVRGMSFRVVAPAGSAPRLALALCAFPDRLLAETVDEALAAEEQRPGG